VPREWVALRAVDPAARAKTPASGRKTQTSWLAPKQTAPFLSFICSACAKHLKVKAELAGKKVKCPEVWPGAWVVPEAQAESPSPDGKRSVSSRPARSAGSGVCWCYPWRPSSAQGFSVAAPPGEDSPGGMFPWVSEFSAAVRKNPGSSASCTDMEGPPHTVGRAANAKMIIPIDPRHPPEAVRLYLNPFRPPSANQTLALQIVVNRRELFKEQIPAEPWERTFELKDIGPGREK